MSNKKSFFLFLIILFIVIVAIVLENFGSLGVYEKVYSIDSSTFDSGDNAYSYNAMVTDDTITFYDKDGNSIIYVFEADRLVNVFNVYNAKSEAEAKRIATHYTKQIGNGEIYDVNYKGTTVSVRMDINYFSEYKDYSKKQIEDLLLKTAKEIDNEEWFVWI